MNIFELESTLQIFELEAGASVQYRNKTIFFHHQISLFNHCRLPFVLFSMKTAESREIDLGSRIVDFDDVQV
jgi:hypothetical protein